MSAHVLRGGRRLVDIDALVRLNWLIHDCRDYGRMDATAVSVVMVVQTQFLVEVVVVTTQMRIRRRKWRGVKQTQIETIRVVLARVEGEGERTR